MKLKTSFITTPFNLVPVLVVSIWGLTICLLLLTAYLLFDGQQLQENNVALSDDLEKLDARWQSTYDTGKQTLSSEQFEQLKNRLSKINQLTEMSKQDLALILSRLERLLPEQFYLLSLNYRSTSDDISLLIESSDNAKVANFIDKLERDNLFNDIAIVRQAHITTDAGSGVQFEVRIKSGGVSGDS